MAKDREEDLEALGSDLEQMIAMLEKAEVDYEVDDEDEEETILDINNSTRMTFNEDGDLLSVDQISN